MSVPGYLQLTTFTDRRLALEGIFRSGHNRGSRMGMRGPSVNMHYRDTIEGYNTWVTYILLRGCQLEIGNGVCDGGYNIRN
jgi:hypothetical protein